MNTANEIINVGFCPTMGIFMDERLDTEMQLKKTALGSAAQVLAFLREGNLNMGLIGRLATKMELNEKIKVKRLWKGYTLIGQFKTAISEEEVPFLKISTYLPKEKVEKFIPGSKKILYYDTIDKAITEGIFSAVLIDWDDWKDEYELVIPVNRSGIKTLKFRTPTLYYYEQFEDEANEISEKLKKIVEKEYEI